MLNNHVVQILNEQLLQSFFPFVALSLIVIYVSLFFLFLTPSVSLSCLQLVNSRVVDGIAFSAVRLHHVAAMICGYSDMCGHRGKSMPQQRSQTWGLMRSAQLTSGQISLLSSLYLHIYATKEK